MKTEEKDRLFEELEQMEWLMRCLFTDIDNGDVISAGIGIIVALDKVSHIKDVILDNKNNMEEKTNGK